MRREIMEQQNELAVRQIEAAELQGGSELLKKTIDKHGLITIIQESTLDVRPNSLLITALCSTGGVYGDFTIPRSNNVLLIDGILTKNELKDLMDTSGFPKDQHRIHYFSTTNFNQEKEHIKQSNYFLTDSVAQEMVNEVVRNKNIDVVIIHTWATCTDHFLEGAERDVIAWLRNLQEKGVAIILYCEKSAKGVKLLQDISSVTFTVTQVTKGLDASILVECDKYSAYEPNVPKPFSFSMSHGNGKAWDITQTDVSPQIFDLIIDLNDLTSKTQAEIAADVGCNQSTVCRNIAKAKAAGIIDGNGKRINRTR